jgi:hypothetical protein
VVDVEVAKGFNATATISGPPQGRPLRCRQRAEKGRKLLIFLAVAAAVEKAERKQAMKRTMMMSKKKGSLFTLTRVWLPSTNNNGPNKAKGLATENLMTMTMTAV